MTNSTSVYIDDETLANSITKKLPTVSPLSPKCCIFRVPEVLCRLNEKVYEPDIFAIGPYHRKKKSLKPMEDVKKWYLHNLLSRTNISMLRLIEGTKRLETRARECYQVPIDVDDEENEFMEMMIIDGCFLIELFQKEAGIILTSKDDPIFSMACMRQYLYHDLLLLENQLPWFILENLFNLTNDQTYFSLTELVLIFFRTCVSMSNSYGARLPLNKENLHILDLIRDVLVSSYSGTDQTKSERIAVPYLMIPCVTRLLEARVKFKKGSPGCIMNIKFKSPSSDKPKIKLPCVTRLLEAGVKFKKGSRGQGIMNIKFTNGSFEIPPLFIQETTEPMFRNLIAFEQCYHECDDKITSYAIVMDRLINTGKDMEYLVEEEIIENWLSDEEASQFFNQLYNDTLVVDFYYAELFKSVYDYYKKPWHKWRATLMRDYLTTPWTIISLIAAFILLVLTFLQTLYSIKQF